MWKKKQNKFPGGIHPTDGYDKVMTMELPVHEYWPEAFMAAPLHASVSGEVLRVEEVINQGRNIQACVIKREEISK